MLSFIINAVLNTAISKPKITKEAIAVGISAAVAFLFSAFALSYSMLVVKELLVSNGLVELHANGAIALGSLLLAITSVLMAKRFYNKMTKKKEGGVDKILNLADAFILGLQQPSKTREQTEKKDKNSKII